MRRTMLALPALLLAAGCSTVGGEKAVVYEVTGQGATKGLITYTTGDGQEQENGATIPWTKDLKVKGGTILVLSVQNAGGGAVTCSIKVDGKVAKTSTAKGDFAIASCQGTA